MYFFVILSTADSTFSTFLIKTIYRDITLLSSYRRISQLEQRAKMSQVRHTSCSVVSEFGAQMCRRCRPLADANHVGIAPVCEVESEKFAAAEEEARERHSSADQGTEHHHESAKASWFRGRDSAVLGVETSD